VILAAITVASLNYSAQKERISEAARSTQTFIEGAKDRAIFARSPVGVRLVLNQNGPRNSAGRPITVSSLQYVGSPAPFTGRISLSYNSLNMTEVQNQSLKFWWPGPDNAPGIAGDDDGTPPPVDDSTDEFGDPMADIELTQELNDFNRYEALGLLAPGVEIKIWKGAARPLTFTLVKVGTDWRLSTDYPGFSINDAMELNFSINLLPAALPNQTVREFAAGLCIDLEATRHSGGLPGGWYDPGQNRYSDYMDIMFSPRGIGFGSTSGYGLINLVVTEAANVERSAYTVGLNANEKLYYMNFAVPTDIRNRQEPERDRVVTVNPKTGHIYMSEIDFTDFNTVQNPPDGTPNNFPDDPFKFAETGETTK
jgi:hypothetical protein